MPTKKEKVEELMTKATHMLAAVKSIADDKMKVFMKELKAKRLWDQEQGKKLIKELSKESEKFVGRMSQDLQTLSNKLMKSSPVLSKEACLKLFATKGELRAASEKLARKA